mgnify:CR=1 FL=1
MIVFSDKSRRLFYYHTDTKETKNLNARGINSSQYGTIIAFVTLEKDEGDLNGDGDEEDSIIQYYDTRSETTKNSDETGTNPLALDRYIVFDASEREAGEDFNNDNDIEDSVIRVYDTQTGSVINTKVEGTCPRGFQKSPVIITHDGKLSEFYIETKKARPLGITGENPSYRDGVLAYERDGLLYIYTAGTERPLNIHCLLYTSLSPRDS